MLNVLKSIFESSPKINNNKRSKENKDVRSYFAVLKARFDCVLNVIRIITSFFVIKTSSIQNECIKEKYKFLYKKSTKN